MLAGVVISFALSALEATLHEPIWLDFAIHNQDAEAIQLDLGQNRKSNFEFIITEPDGSVVPAPRLRVEGISRIGRLSLSPNTHYRQRLLVNEWHDFARPGPYLIAVSVTGPIRTQSGKPIVPRLSDRLSLQLRPRDPSRLTAVCAELARVAIESTEITEATAAALALSHVRDPIAIPFLEKILEQRRQLSSYSILGFRRIANPEAIALLIAKMHTDPPEIRALAGFALLELKGTVEDARLKDQIDAVLRC